MATKPRLLLLMQALSSTCAAQHAVQVHPSGEVTNVTYHATSAATGARGQHLVRSAKLMQDDEMEVEEGDVGSDDDSEAGWKLAAMVVRENVMVFNWGGWNNCDNFDQAGDKKTALYCARAKKLRITFVGRPRGVFEYTYNGKHSVKDLFNGGYVQSGDVAHWHSAMGCHQNGACQQRGFRPAASSWAKCRFGLVGNNEDDCNTPDGHGGVGCEKRATGAWVACCSNVLTTPHHSCHQAFHTKIEIIPVTCSKAACPESDGHFLKEEDLPEFCKGETCTKEECCVTTTTTTTTAAKSSGLAKRLSPLLLAPLVVSLGRP